MKEDILIRELSLSRFLFHATGIRELNQKTGICIARISCSPTKSYRDFLNCRPKVYLFNTHWLWKYLQNWPQIHPRSKLAIKTFSRRNRIWSSFSADRLDRWSVATTPPYEKSLSTLVALGGGVRWRLATRSRAFLALSFGEEFS